MLQTRAELALDLPFVYTSGSNRAHFCFQTPSLTTSRFPGKILIKQPHCSALAQHFSIPVRLVKAQVLTLLYRQLWSPCSLSRACQGSLASCCLQELGSSQFLLPPPEAAVDGLPTTWTLVQTWTTQVAFDE